MPEEEGDEVIPRFRLRMVKKLGDLNAWYEVLNQMKQTVFLKQVAENEEMILLAPRTHGVTVGDN